MVCTILFPPPNSRTVNAMSKSCVLQGSNESNDNAWPSLVKMEKPIISDIRHYNPFKVTGQKEIVPGKQILK